MISNKNKAFTLVETLVVIVIIVILSLIIIPNYNSLRQELAFQRSVSRLAQEIRAVQEMAMSAQELECETPGDDCGYGIYLKTVPETVPATQPQTSYVLYADKNNNQKYDSGGGLGETIEEVNLESGIKILDLISGKHINIIFTPPDPTVFFTDADGIDLGLSQISIVISLISDETKTKTIKVNKAGLIYVE